MEMPTQRRSIGYLPSTISTNIAQTIARSASARGRFASLRIAARRALYAVWAVLPSWSRQIALKVMLPRVSLGACAVIQDGRGQVLVVRHTYRTPAWGLPGGFVRNREDPAKALVRELHEELGVQVALGPILSAERHMRTGHLTLYYGATLLSAPTVDHVELDGLRYTQPEELLTLYGAEARKWFPALAKAS